MILAFDTHYFDNQARTVCVAFERWDDETASAWYSDLTTGVEQYTPGEFYRRELPCILNLLKKIDVHPLEAIVVDGYVYLDDSGKPGLGAHLYHALEGRVPVVGVAKSNFATVDRYKRPLFRGGSRRPLFITSIGMDMDQAASQIASMSGGYRLPALLKMLDTRTRQA